MATYEIGFKGGQRVNLNTPQPANLIAQLKQAAAAGWTWYTPEGLDEPYLICIPDIAYLIPAPVQEPPASPAVAKAVAKAVAGARAKKPSSVDLNK